MYQLKIDITDHNYLTRTENEGIFKTIESARRAAQEKRNILFYSVDIVPVNQ